MRKCHEVLWQLRPQPWCLCAKPITNANISQLSKQNNVHGQTSSAAKEQFQEHNKKPNLLIYPPNSIFKSKSSIHKKLCQSKLDLQGSCPTAHRRHRICSHCSQDISSELLSYCSVSCLGDAKQRYVY